MPPAPLVASALLGASAVSGTVALAIDPDPFTPGAATLLAIGAGLLTLVTISGILLARGRWSRWTALVVAALWFGVALAGHFDAAEVTTLVLATAAAGVAAGPWLPLWLRRLPSAEGPPPSAVVLLLLLVATPALLAVADPAASIGWEAWTFSGWSLLLAFGIARALPAALWAGRIAHPAAAVGAAILLGLSSAVVVIAAAAAATVLMWRRDLHLAVSPLLPEKASIVPMPPELVDPAIMEAAGLDDRGRPLEAPPLEDT